MTDAPKRIWMDPTSEDEDGFFIVETEKCWGNMDVEYIRYTRTDIADELAEALEAASAVLDGFLKEYGGCDHDVGICMCGEEAVANQARAALAKYKGDIE